MQTRKNHANLPNMQSVNSKIVLQNVIHHQQVQN